jgi:hypothetical protein
MRQNLEKMILIRQFPKSKSQNISNLIVQWNEITRHGKVQKKENPIKNYYSIFGMNVENF